MDGKEKQPTDSWKRVMNARKQKNTDLVFMKNFSLRTSKKTQMTLKLFVL